MGQDLAWIETLYAQVATLPGQNVKVADTVRAPIKTVGSNYFHSDFFFQKLIPWVIVNVVVTWIPAQSVENAVVQLCVRTSLLPPKKILSHLTAL